MQILFRGKRIDNGEWVYWNEFGEYTEPFLDEHNMHSHVSKKEIDTATVGQYTGLDDKNGKKIFEGDVLSYSDSRELVQFNTELRIPCFTTGIGRGSSTDPHPYKISKRHAVIGNIHDNPELLEV